MSGIQSGDKVAIHYRGTFQDGNEFDSSQGREPLEFTAGSDELIPGMSNAVIGMAVGEPVVSLPSRCQNAPPSIPSCRGLPLT